MSKLLILGSKVNDLSLDQVINKIHDHLGTFKKAYIVTPNPEICLLGYQDKQLRRIIKIAWLGIPDGFGLKIGSLFWGKRLKNTTTGIDLSERMLKLAEQNNYSVLLLGGKQETGLLALKKITDKYSKLTVSYLNGGEFDNHGKSNEANLIDSINKLSPDIILVCLGAPKQEYFMYENIDRLNTKLMIGVGGSIDFWAGKITRAPQLWRRLGLEWLWRLIKEPWRWQRIINAVIIFPVACLIFRFGSLFVYRNNVAGFIINKNKQILIAKQSKLHYWQLPQGGAKKAKTKQEFEQAILRELKQEIGTDNCKILDWCKKCYKYTWPAEDRDWDHFKGQKQTLFLLSFQGQDKDIKLDRHEFIDWQWVAKDDILNKVGEVKKPLIQIALNEFKNYL